MNERTGGYTGMSNDDPNAVRLEQSRMVQSELDRPGNSQADIAGLTRELARLGGQPTASTAAPRGALSSPELTAAIRQAGATPIANPQEDGPVGVYGALSQTADAAIPPAQGALTQAAPLQRNAPPDIAAMLAQYMPQDDSQSKYLALAAGFGSATKTGSFGEQIGNVASALSEQKMNQQKLRSQYVPLIMQQVAAQQAREEQAQNRQIEQQAMLAERQRAQQAQLAQQKLLADQAIAARADAAALADATRRDLSADRIAASQAAIEAARAGRVEPAPQLITTPDGVFALGRDGKMSALTNPGTGKPLSGKSSAPMSVALQKELIDSDDVVQSSKNVVNTLNQALNINKDAYSGWGAKGRAVVASNLPGNYSGADATINLDNMMNGQALESLKSIFGAAPTEGERKILLDLQASADKTPAQRESIIRRSIVAAENRSNYAAKKAKSIRDGNYLSEGLAPMESAANPATAAPDFSALARAELANRNKAK